MARQTLSVNHAQHTPARRYHYQCTPTHASSRIRPWVKSLTEGSRRGSTGGPLEGGQAPLEHSARSERHPVIVCAGCRAR